MPYFSQKPWEKILLGFFVFLVFVFVFSLYRGENWGSDARRNTWLLPSSSHPVFLCGLQVMESSWQRLAGQPGKWSLQESAPCSAEQSGRKSEIGSETKQNDWWEPFLISQPKGMCPDSDSPWSRNFLPPWTWFIIFAHVYDVYLWVLSPLIYRL